MIRKKKPIKRIRFFICSISLSLLILFSCNGDAETSGEVDGVYVRQDSIVEYELDENRLSAVDFNNELTLMQEDMLNVIETLFLSDSAMIETNHENTLFEAQMNLSELEQMQFDGSEDKFVEEMKNLMNFYIDELENSFIEIIPLIKKTELTDAEIEILDQYDRTFADREKEIFMKIFEAQDEFAEANNISLE